jgi:hypothetical protein
MPVGMPVGMSRIDGIGISRIADIDVHHRIVTAALATKSTPDTPRNACCEARSEAMRRETRPSVIMR